MKRLLILLPVVLMIIALSPPSLAVTVDGIKSPGEWNEDWAYGQDRNASHPAPVFPYGDRMEVEQDKTGIINMEDPSDDSGPNNDESMATIGPFKSGFDIGKVYVHYDLPTDTIIGMVIAYGKPGDLDGNDDIGENCGGNGDCLGDPGPGGLLGIGPGETFTVKIDQGTMATKIVIGQNNNWQAGLEGLAYKDVHIAWTTTGQPDGTDPEPVLELSISNVSTYFDMSPGAEPIVVYMVGGGISDIPGEDTAQMTFFFPPPCKLGDFVWNDINEDGIQDPGEPGIPNVQVDLYDNATGAYITSDNTDASGYYLFDDLNCPQCYDIILNENNFIPGGALYSYNASPQNVGFNDEIDSDGDPKRILNRCLPTSTGEREDLTNDYGWSPVPALTPFGLLVMAGLLGVIGILGIRIKR
jgi:hypothetical protein